MVEVDRKHFYVERQLLAHHSAIFRDLIQDIWHGDEPVTLHLGYEEYGADAATFLCYVECIRSGCKQIPCTARKPLNEQDKEQGHDEYMLLCQVYVFSARVQDQVVQNTVMDALLHKFHEVDVNSMHWLPSDVVITYAYSRTEAGSPLRRFIADTYIWAGTEDHLRQNPATVHKGFFVDIAAAYLRKINDEGRDCKIPTRSRAATIMSMWKAWSVQAGRGRGRRIKGLLDLQYRWPLRWHLNLAFGSPGYLQRNRRHH